MESVGLPAFSLVIGLAMAFIFRNDERERNPAAFALPDDGKSRPLSQTAVFFGVLTGILVFANWGAASQPTGFFAAVFSVKWTLTALLAAALAKRRFGRTHWSTKA